MLTVMCYTEMSVAFALASRELGARNCPSALTFLTDLLCARGPAASALGHPGMKAKEDGLSIVTFRNVSASWRNGDC